MIAAATSNEFVVLPAISCVIANSTHLRVQHEPLANLSEMFTHRAMRMCHKYYGYYLMEGVSLCSDLRCESSIDYVYARTSI